MTVPLRVLFIEDSEDDLQLELLELKRGGFEPDWQRVDTQAGLDRALHALRWDIIISDHVMPAFSSHRALAFLREREVDTPVIVVSGAAPEEIVTDAMRAGARDFISKDSLLRLVPAVKRELQEYATRKERGQFASRLAESEGRYEALFNENPAPMLLVDAATLMVVDANPSAAAFFGHSLASLKETTVQALSDRAHSGAWRQVQRAKDQRSYLFSDNVLCADGTRRDIDVCAVKLSRSGRSLLLATLFDQTERRAAEAALKESEARFRALADSTPMLIWTAGTDAQRDYFNRPWLDFTGRDLELELGHGWQDGVHPEDLGFCRETLRQAFQQRTAVQLEYRLRREDAEYRWILERGIPRFDQDGVCTGFVGASLDISDRRAAEEGMAKLAAAMAQVSDAVAITNAVGRIEYVNQAFEALTGLAYEEVERHSLGEVLDHEGLRDALRFAAHGEPWEGRVNLPLAGHPSQILAVSCSPVRNSVGMIANVVVMLRDITSNVEMERQLSQARKMDALGVMAAGIAHDFNNFLTTILTATQLIKSDLPEGSGLHTKVDAISQAGLCAAGLTKQILSFSHMTEEKRIPMDLSAVVKNALQMLRSTKPMDIELESELASGIWVEGDPVQLHQVMLNLSINAFHAMGTSGGTLRVALSEVAADEELLGLGLESGLYALLEVGDTGCGMDAAIIEKIFDPFFTTKPSGKGTGLGLSLVHAAVTKARGQIKVKSQPGEGTTFLIYWPCVKGKELPATQNGAEDLKGKEHILFVDDEELVAALAKMALQNLGYAVTARTTSPEALEEIRQHGAEYDLVFTDLIMPEMNGAELATKIHELQPDLPVLLVSGLPMSKTLPFSAQARFQGVVAKPFTLRELAASARKALSERVRRSPGLEPAALERAPRARRIPLILLAEDSHTTRAMIRSWLEKAGYEVRVAQDGQEAWELFTAGPDHSRFDLLLTDVVMPRLDGLELTRLVRMVDPALPIAILTSNEDRETVKSAIHSGANELLNKPFEMEELLQCVGKLLSGHETRREARRYAETAQAVRLAQRTMVAVPEKDLPVYSLYEPLSDAGGDVFRCVKCADGSILFILADVAGHSVLSSYAVAAFLAMLSTFVGECCSCMALTSTDNPGPRKACGLRGTTPCTPLAHLAQKLNQGIQSGPFSEIPVCALLGLWDPASGTLQLLNAGIPHALLFRKSEERATVIELNGTPLGVFPEPMLESADLELRTGDRLLLATDGFFDVLSPQRRSFEGSAPSHWESLQESPIDWALSVMCEKAKEHGKGLISDDMLVVGFEQCPIERGKGELTLQFPSTAYAIDMACSKLESWFRAHPIGSRLDASRRFDILVAVREALTNAVFHGNEGDEGALVKLQCKPDCGTRSVVITVMDEGPGFDLEHHEPPSDPLSERGRGIPLIQAYAQDVRMAGSELTMTFQFQETVHDHA